MSDTIKYRLFEKSDIDGILRLWEEESGWGGITEQQFYKWYVNTPFGDCLTVVAVDKEGRIIGQTVFMPSKFHLAGDEKKALRVLAPIISKDFRDNIKSAAHPFFGMYKFGLEAGAKQGYNIFYTFPAHTWLAIMRFLPKAGLDPVEMSEFDCYVISPAACPDDRFSGVENITILPVCQFDPDFDLLWNSAKVDFPIHCGIVRDAEWLNWKLNARLSFAAYNLEKELIGYVSIDKKTSLLIDALAQTPQDLEHTVAALIRFLKSSTELGINEIKLMKTSFLQDIVDKLGFTKVDFKFAFGCYSTDPRISAEKIKPSLWYMMPND